MAMTKRKNSTRDSELAKSRVKRKKTDDGGGTPFLSNDIMMNIFSRIPANNLQRNFMFQCKEWFNMFSKPSFHEANALNSKPGIIFMGNRSKKEYTKVLRFIEFKGLGLKVRQITPLKFPSDTRIISSSRGLLLIGRDNRSHDGVSVLNPTTKQIIRFPACEHECHWHELVFVPSTKEYKLVDMFYDTSRDSSVYHIRSVGGGWNDSYCLSDSLESHNVPGYWSMVLPSYWDERISINGILYVNTNSSKLVSFNLCSKRERVLKLPVSESVKLVELGGSLGFVHGDSKDYGEFPLHVWILKDITTPEWEKRYIINAFPKHFGVDYFYWNNAVRTLNDVEVIVFQVHHKNGILTYNLKTHEWNSYNVKPADTAMFGYVHINSLVTIMSRT